MARGRHPHAYVMANAEAARRAIQAAQAKNEAAKRTVLEAIAIAREQGEQLDNPVSGPEYERAILALHRLGISHNMSAEPYTLRIVAGQGDYITSSERPIERLERQHKDIFHIEQH